MRNRRVTAPLVLTRILRHLWDEGCLKDVSYLTEAHLWGDDQITVRGHSVYSGEMEWRSVHWDEDWDIAG